jgi:glyoxylase-like metal-dependent hydrolase (beta-lactamase superfamily II)
VDIKTIKVGPYRTNCYIVSQKSGETFIVDPGADSELILEQLSSIKNLELKYILLTHAHFDHVGALTFLHQQYPKVPIYLHEADFKLFNELPEQGLFVGEIVHQVRADLEAVSDGEYLPFGDDMIRVVHSPGHTPGGVCYLLNENLFTGDTLFFETVGRTDLPYSNEFDLKKSLTKILGLSDDTKILPGHGKSSVLSHERTNNLHLVQL